MADVIGSEDKEKSLYLIQIKYLDEQLERYQLQCDELEQQNKDLASQYSALEKDKQDITEYLKHAVLGKDKEAEELAAQLESQQRIGQQDREARVLQQSQEVQELQDQIDELTSESRLLVAKFEEQQELAEQLEQLLQRQSEMEFLRKQLVSENEEHDAAIENLKNDAESERNKMFEVRWGTLEVCVRKKASHIIQEERAQHRELREKVEELLDRNTELWSEKNELRDTEDFLLFQLDNMKEDIDKVSKKSFTSKKEVEQLTKTCQQLRAELKRCSAAYDTTLTKKEALRQRLASVSAKCHQKTAQAGQLRAELQRESSARRQLEAIVQEAVLILSHILMDSEKVSETQWKRLQEILQSPPSTPEEEPQTCDPEAARAQTLNIATDPLFLFARYRPGDLGLVPRPMWKQKAAFSRSRHPGASQQETVQSEDIQL
ncbi:cilia- and flagella-associated protein 157-like isoform X2 [Perca fluviatilis]|uniref:cilia- and flagella-associated protein 157-like isoform X2 n=1 Tax=Perca fluviatilis TaxID=8168 RepID=UPI001964851D|nr:cilia- and flagella-associated protein 157-like isoform X2 [Perca fluviatilis]